MSTQPPSLTTHAGHPSSPEPAEQMVQLARQISDRQTFRLDTALARALRLAVLRAPGVQWATFTTSLAGSVPSTWASTSAVASALDGLQYGFGQGPCLDALHTGSTVVAEDLTRDDRWPDFTVAAVRTSPVRTIVSYPLAPTGRPGTTLNLYGDDPGVMAGRRAEVLTAAAGTALTMAAIGARELAENLGLAMVTNRRIGAAIGILMHQYDWSEEQAFAAMRKRSQHQHCKLRSVADEIVAAGELPAGSPSESPNEPSSADES